MKNIAHFVLATATLLTGCKTKTLYFGTNTSLGLDVSGTTQVPNKVSLAYQRSEAAIVPRGKDGNELAVLGRFDSDVKFFGDFSIYQLFATGEAARVAAGNNSEAPVPGLTENKATSESLIFATHAVFGFDLSAGSAQLAPQMVLGYKRGEATAIPLRVDDEEARSVYAEISISSTDDARTIVPATAGAAEGKVFPTTVGGVRIVQSFATGKAATALARQSPAQKKLTAAVGLKSIAEVDSEVETAKSDYANAYNQATHAGDSTALAAFESAAAAAGFGSASQFFVAPNLTQDQVMNFDTAARGNPASAKYLTPR